MKKPKKPTKRGGLPASTLPQGIASFVSMLSLKTVRLVESCSKLSIADDKLPTELGVSVDVRIAVSGQGSKLLGNLVATLRTPNESESSISIMVDIQCVFDVPSVPDVSSLPQDVRNDISATVISIAWPYVRHHVHAMTASMAVPPFTLPLFHVGMPPVISSMVAGE